MVYFSSEDILNIVQDNEWHPLHDFIHLADSVPPEHACRKYLSMHSDQKESRQAKAYEQRIVQGRRRIVLNRLADMVRRGVLERKQEAKVPHYRKPPQGNLRILNDSVPDRPDEDKTQSFDSSDDLVIRSSYAKIFKSLGQIMAAELLLAKRKASQ